MQLKIRRATDCADSAVRDGLDRLTQEQVVQGTMTVGTVNCTYDAASRRATMTVSGQSQVTYTWDNADRLTQVAQGSAIVGFTYDNAMPGLVPGIYVFVALTKARKAWMAGTSPAMTEGDGSARKQKIRERSQSDLGRPVLFAKIFRFVIYPNHF